MIRADGVGHAYDGRAVLVDVALSAAPGEVVALVGPNGSGKTTLLRTLHRALSPDSGVVTVDGDRVDRLSPREISRRVAVVVQQAPSEMPLTVLDDVLLGRAPYLPAFRRPGPHDRAVATAALRRVGALDLAAREVTTLSGGERQRVLVARALVQEPRFLLLDEPTNHLDVHYAHEVLDLVRGLGVTVVVVLHDLNLAARYCDRLVLLENGRVRAHGTPHEMLVPEIVEPVYRVRAERVVAPDGVPQILFRHLGTDPARTENRVAEDLRAAAPATQESRA